MFRFLTGTLHRAAINIPASISQSDTGSLRRTPAWFWKLSDGRKVGNKVFKSLRQNRSRENWSNYSVPRFFSCPLFFCSDAPTRVSRAGEKLLKCKGAVKRALAGRDLALARWYSDDVVRSFLRNMFLTLIYRPGLRQKTIAARSLGRPFFSSAYIFVKLTPLQVSQIGDSRYFTFLQGSRYLDNASYFVRNINPVLQTFFSLYCVFKILEFLLTNKTYKTKHLVFVSTKNTMIWLMP